MRPDSKAVEAIVGAALVEDAPWGDLTSQSLIAGEAAISARLVAREAGVLCGEDLFAAAMLMTGPAVVQFKVHDGEHFRMGDLIAMVDGPAQRVLQAERVALNFIQRLSGIATLTAQYVAKTAGTKTRIVDTRKTTPGLRLLERYAVRCGGGHNHRFSLSDAVMAKDNHLAVLTRCGNGNLTELLMAGFARLPHTTHKEVEVDRLDQIEALVAAGVDTIMLDNFSIEDLRAGVKQVAGRALVEASGSVGLDRVRDIAATGVDVISVGALTHSARALDLGLDFQH